MNDYQTLIRIFKFATITFKYNYTLNKREAFINNYNKPDIYIDFYFVLMLAELNILEIDSANSETHETHYKLNTDIVEIKNNIRIIKLNYLIQKYILSNSNINPDNETFIRINNCLIKIKDNDDRKKKLNKLKNINYFL